MSAPYEKQVRIEVPASWTNDSKGKFFEKIVAELLETSRYCLIPRIDMGGMEVDLLAEHLDSKDKAYVECKFEKTPLSPQVVSQAMGNADALDIPLVYIFSTAQPTKGARNLIEKFSNRDKKPKLSYHSADDLFDWFVGCRRYSPPSLEKYPKVRSLTLLITPDFSCWVAEEMEGGIPTRAIAFPIKNSGSFRFEILKNYFPDISR